MNRKRTNRYLSSEKETKTHMNYKDFFKKKAVKVNENLDDINDLDNDAVSDGLPKGEDGALDIPHLGQPIHMSKIIQVGAIGTGKPASGEVSGYTNVSNDKETITAGGKPVSTDFASKSVGGAVVPGQGQKQGGPNTKGSIANTPKNSEISSENSQKFTPEMGNEEGEDLVLNLPESKKHLRDLVKESLKDIIFDKKSGKWVKINESNHKTGCKCAFCKNKGSFGKKSKKDNKKEDIEENTVDTKTGSDGNYKGTYDGLTNRIYDLILQNPKIAQIKNVWDLFKFGLKVDDLKPSLSQAESALVMAKKLYTASLRGKGNLGENTVNMKMGSSYKKVQPRMYQTSEDDWARKNQYEPEITENFDEEDLENKRKRYSELVTVSRNLNENELGEMKSLRLEIEKMEESSYKVASQTQSWGEKDDHARTVQTDPHISENEEDDYERQQWQSGIDKHNKSNPQRFECPTCHTPNALNAWQKKQGYQCNACADAEEGPMEESDINPPKIEIVKDLGRQEGGRFCSVEHLYIIKKDGKQMTVTAEELKNLQQNNVNEAGGMEDNKPEKSTCPQCKGKGYHGATLKDRAGRNPHGLGNYHAAVPCDFPGCHNGVVDREENYKQYKSVDEAGGQSVQHRSYRTVDDLPQNPDARWSSEVYEESNEPIKMPSGPVPDWPQGKTPKPVFKSKDKSVDDDSDDSDEFSITPLEENEEKLMGGQPGKLSATEYVLVRLEDGGQTAIVKDTDNGKLEKWGRNENGSAGFSLKIGDDSYEFMSSSNIEEKKDKWIQKAVDKSHKGFCTPMTKTTCTPHRKALAKRFKSGDLDEGESKKSEVRKQIEKSNKGNKKYKPDDLQHKTVRKTSTGVHKKS